MRKATGSQSAGIGTERCTATEPWSRNLVHLMDSTYMNTQNTVREKLWVSKQEFSCLWYGKSNLNSSSKKLMFIVLVMTQSNSMRIYRTLDFCISQPTIYIT